MLTAFPSLEFLRCPWTSGSKAHMTFFYFAMQEDVESYGGSHTTWKQTLSVKVTNRFLLSMSNLSNKDNKQTTKTTLQCLWVRARGWQNNGTLIPSAFEKREVGFIFPYFDYSGLVKKKIHVECDKSWRVWVYSFSLNNCAKVPLSFFYLVELVSTFCCLLCPCNNLYGKKCHSGMMEVIIFAIVSHELMSRIISPT